MAHEGLGADSTFCAGAFIEAMRAPLLAEQAAAEAAGETEKAEALAKAAANLDDPQVRKNIAPFGEAVFQIVAVRARTASDATTDAQFWQWVAAVGAWLAALSNWRAGVTQAFTNWAAATPSEQALRNAVIGVASPGPPPGPPPPGLLGRVE